MELPTLYNYSNKSSVDMMYFGGINRTQSALANELLDCKNIDDTDFPYLTTVKGDISVNDYTNATNIYAKDKLCVIDGTDFIYDGEVVGTVTEGDKQIVTVNTRICVFPDKVYFDTEEEEFGLLEEVADGGTAVFTENTITLTLGDISSLFGRLYTSNIYPYTYTYSSVSWEDGAWVTTGGESVKGVGEIGKYIIPTVYEDGSFGTSMHFSNDSRPTENQIGVYGIITSSETYDNDSTDMQMYKIEVTLYDGTLKFDEMFAVGDAVFIEGCTEEEDNDTSAIIREIEDYTLTFDNDIFIATTESEGVTITRKIPDLEFICESDNRLWGVEGDTIYASSLGDPKNFFTYEGLSTDSYTLAVGSGGDFTGCINHSSGICFFKELYIHKILGSTPQTYSMYTYNAYGVRSGCSKSLITSNEIIYYLGLYGVYAYSGGMPSCISDNLGNDVYISAVSGMISYRLYMNMATSSGSYSTYVYSIKNNLWFKYDDRSITQFAVVDNILHALIHGEIIQLNVSDCFDDEWFIEFNPITEYTFDKKTYYKFEVKLKASGYFEILISLDDKPYKCIYKANKKRGVISVPITPNLCDSLKIKLQGTESCSILGLQRTVKTLEGL